MTLVPQLGETGELVRKALLAVEDDDEAALLARMIVGDLMLHDLYAHQHEIAKAFGEHVERRAELLSKSLGVDVAELVSKAGEERFNLRDEHGRYSGSGTERRAQEARMRYDRLVGGEHVVAHEPLSRTLNGPVNGRVAARLGIPDPGKAAGVDASKLSASQRARFQGDYMQVQAMLRPFTRLPAGDAFGHVVYTDGTEDVFEVPRDGSVPVGGAGEPGMNPAKVASSVKVSVLPSESASGGIYAGLSGLGVSPSRAAMAAGVTDGGLGDADRIRGFGEDWNRRGDDEQFTGARAMRRVGEASQLLDDSFGNALGARARMALKVGQHVGSYGPEAQKVIGPTADRAAYRYRGTEREPEQGVKLSVAAVRGNPNLTPAQKNRGATHGLTREDGTWEAGPLLMKMKGLLPDQALNRLHLASGTVPPSEGVLINAKGEVVAQAIGYGDDHYLPFNLKHLGKLKGGQYVRTRTLGGPTTEDLYTGLASGARSMTVVSHNGVYTVDFDPSFKGGRRFNDKAARMVGRYGQLLDAVESRQVTGDIPGPRRAELEAEASRGYDPERNPDGYRTEMTRLENRERRNPQLSGQAKVAAAQEFFTERAERLDDGTGTEMSGQQLVDTWVTGEAQKRVTAAQTGSRQAAIAYSAARKQAEGMGVTREVFEEQYPPPAAASLDLATAKQQVVAENMVRGDQLKTFQNFADAMGIRPGLDQALEGAAKANKQAMDPLSLNGQGYATALDALKEQFPYYISGVEFHPWTDGAAGTDTGYVKPRHLRPAKALAGFYDRTINGGLGKVTADSIRGQAGRQLNRVGARESETKADKPAAGKPAAAMSDADKAELKEDAVRAAADHLRTFRDATFIDGARQAEGKDIAGQPMSALLGATKPLDGLGDLHKLLNLDDDALAKMPVSQLDTLVRSAGKQARGRLDVDTAVLDRADRGGLDPEAGKLTGTLSGMLGQLDTDHEFDGSDAFRKGNTDLAAVTQAYADDPQIQRLVADNLLPPIDVVQSAGDLDGPVAAAKKVLSTRIGERNAWVARASQAGRGPEPHTEPELRAQVEGLARAAQLGRRHTEALRAREANTDYEVDQRAAVYDPETGTMTPVNSTQDLEDLFGTPTPPRPSLGS